MRKSNYIQRIESTCTEQYDWYIKRKWQTVVAVAQLHYTWLLNYKATTAKYYYGLCRLDLAAQSVVISRSVMPSIILSDMF